MLLLKTKHEIKNLQKPAQVGNLLLCTECEKAKELSITAQRRSHFSDQHITTPSTLNDGYTDRAYKRHLESP
jgi:hypothetical protein